MLIVASVSLVLAQLGAQGLAQLSDEQLISELTKLSTQGTGYHASAWSGQFLALDEEPVFHGGIIGAPKPQPSPVMREIVRRGVSIVPELLESIADPRETGLIVEHKGGFGGMWHGKEYDPRYSDPRRRPAGIDRGLGTGEHMGRYTIRVGDLCFVALGQIVNRGLSCVRYQPTACVVINSPVKSPVLAKAARQDWSGLTAKAHQESLTTDALSYWGNLWAAEPIKRLCFYYPAEGEALAFKLLSRPTYWDDPHWKLAYEVVKTQKKDAWLSLVAKFRKTHGETAVLGIPRAVWWVHMMTSSEHTTKDQATAKAFLVAMFPKFDASAPVFVNAATFDDQAELLEGLALIRSDKIDQAALSLFRSIKPMRRKEVQEQRDLDGIAIHAADRLVGKGHDEELAEHLNARIAELAPRKPEDYTYPGWALKEFRRIAALLRPQFS